MENILTKEELKVVELFRNNLFNEYTIREVMRKIRKKSYNWVLNAINRLNKIGIVHVHVKGKSRICSINLDNQLTLAYLSFLEKSKITDNLPIKNISELMNSVPVAYFSFIIAGSYAEGKATKKSDLDVVVIVENKDDAKKVFAVLKNKGDLMIPKAHIFVFSKEEFLQMLLEKDANYGKEVYKNRVIIFGAENYYLILKEAIDNGFKG